MTDRPSDPSDSAGVPWRGRRFEANPATDDDGTAPPELLAALVGFREGRRSVSDVVDVVRGSRLLVPLVAQLAETGAGVDGLVADKSADLSIVTVAGPDGRPVLPVFSSVEAMARWNPAARPVPTDAVRVALAAAGEGTELIVLDPASETEFALRRPAVWAIAQQKTWNPGWTDAGVGDAFAASVADERAVSALRLAAGDVAGRLVGPEVLVVLELHPGLDGRELAALLARLRARWASSTAIAERVDSIGVRLEQG